MSHAVRLLSAAFLVLLLAAHDAAAGPDDPLAYPLSALRDGPQAALGYCLFALLLAVGVVLIILADRADKGLDVVALGLAGALLVAVALTPSYGGLHALFAFSLLLLLYAYLAGLLFAAGSVWLVVHLAVPVLLVPATNYHSYGLWQKSLIVYFLLALNVRCHVLARQLPAPRKGARSTPAPVVVGKRRVVYAVQAGRSWRRRG